MGAIKGRFQCLQGLCVNINSPDDHIRACRWITVAITLHNLVIDVEGIAGVEHFQLDHPGAQEMADVGEYYNEEDDLEDGVEGEAKRRQLTAELLAYCETWGISF